VHSYLKSGTPDLCTFNSNEALGTFYQQVWTTMADRRWKQDTWLMLEEDWITVLSPEVAVGIIRSIDGCQAHTS
jgi:hypothetical protein